MTYHMSDDAVIPQGYCIIINNNTDYYDDEKMKEIRGVFSDQLGFHVQVYSDLTRKGIKHLLETVANVDHSELYCLVVIVLSKGERERAIYGSDGKKLQLKELMMWFSSDASPTLEEKPKLFFTETQMNEISDTQPVENPKIRDTYTASYYGGLSENKSFTLELAEILSKKCHFVFRNAMEELAASHETNQSLYLYNNLHRLLHFNMCSEIRYTSLYVYYNWIIIISQCIFNIVLKFWALCVQTNNQTVSFCDDRQSGSDCLVVIR